VHIESILTGLSSGVIISTQLPPLHANHEIKKAVQLAVDRLVREVRMIRYPGRSLIRQLWSS
jgi:hypothetical protein